MNVHTAATAVAFADESHVVLADEGGGLRFYDLDKNESGVNGIEVPDQWPWPKPSRVDDPTQMVGGDFFEAAIVALVAAPDGAVTCGADGWVRWWPIAQGELRESSAERSGDYGAVALVRRDTTRVLAGQRSGAIDVLERGRFAPTRTLRGHDARVTALACWGERAVSASRDGTVRVWDLEPGSEIARVSFEACGDVPAAVACAPGSTFYVGTERGAVRRFRLK